MTLGERSLEREVLGLFERQAGLLLPRMPRTSAPAVAALAHTLKGSARGIGAWRRGAAAAAAVANAPARRRMRRCRAQLLAAAVDEARAAIAGCCECALIR